MNLVADVLWVLDGHNLLTGVDEDSLLDLRDELENALARYNRAVAFLDFMESGPDHDQPMLASEWVDEFLSQPV